MANKLGQQGYGPVYKLHDGMDMAVKRLSSSSGQGIEEFKNEVKLISKLQHRNLVRLFGCCVKGEERILIYEFMANKSLDNFFFDPTKRELSWAKCFSIIQGVAHELLYLHRDSCLRVTHCDLKVSNILIDAIMNPKNSDFGLARIFEGTQYLANIQKAWQLWTEGEELGLMGEALADSFSLTEAKRCIQMVLPCVQDHAENRPTMPAVVSMLSSETELLQPKQPTFTFHSPSKFDQPKVNNSCPVNEITMSLAKG